MRLIALSVDAPQDSKRVVEHDHLPFPILADEKHEVITAYGLVHAHGSPDGKEIAIPAHVLIDHDGKILWKHISERVLDRPDPDDVLTIVRGLPAS